MTLAFLLYVAFTVLSVVGAYLIGAHFRSRAAGLGWAVAVLVFFIVLAFALAWLMRNLPGW